MEKQITDSSEQCSILDKRQAKLNIELEEKVVKKQAYMNETLIYQKLSRFYQDLRDKKYKFIAKDEEHRKIELSKARERFGKVESLVESVKLELPPRLKPYADHLELFLQNTIQKVESI
jgi:hypothetical protein